MFKLLCFTFLLIHIINAQELEETDDEKINTIIEDVFVKNFPNRFVQLLIANQTLESDVTTFDSTTTIVEEEDESPDESERLLKGEHVPPCEADHCVPYHLCSNNNTIIRNGEGILNARFNPEETCHYLEVCCEAENKMNTSIITNDVLNQVSESKCGYRYTNGIGLRIAENDFEAQYGEFPWMMAVLNEESHEGYAMNVYLCGGSLIHPEVVLTAAHCIHDKNVSQLKVRAGEWDTQTSNELWHHQDRYVNKMVIHEEFYKASLKNDIGLLLLKDPVELVGHIKTVCLPPPDINFDQSTCVASGWGKDVFGKEGEYQAIMKKLDLPIVDNRKCQTLLRKTRLGRRFVLHRSFICAGGQKGVDTCKGDGGSPLVCPIPGVENRYYQAGIVAWGIGCGEDNIPGVYVAISKFRKWIDKIFMKYDYSMDYYL